MPMELATKQDVMLQGLSRQEHHIFRATHSAKQRAKSQL